MLIECTLPAGDGQRLVQSALDEQVGQSISVRWSTGDTEVFGILRAATVISNGTAVAVRIEVI